MSDAVGEGVSSSVLVPVTDRLVVSTRVMVNVWVAEPIAVLLFRVGLRAVVRLGEAVRSSDQDSVCECVRRSERVCPKVTVGGMIVGVLLTAK